MHCEQSMKRRLVITGSWFLLLLFSVMQILPALHHHNEVAHSIQQSSYHHGQEFKVDKHNSDCLICSFIAYKQIDYPSNFSELTLDYHAGKPVILNSNFSQQLFKSAVHTWTNKGPPTV